MGNTLSFLPGWFRGQPTEESIYETDDATTGVEALNAREAVASGHKIWMAAFEKKNFQALCKLYTRDCKVCPSGTRTAFGRQECSAGWESLVKTGIERIAFSDTMIDTCEGTSLSETSTYYLYGSENKLIDQGKHVMMWRNIGGKWFIHVHIFSSNEKRIKGALENITEACLRWEYSYYTREFSDLANLYTDECVLCPPAWPQVEGKLPLERFWARFPSMGVDRVERIPVSVEDMGPGHVVAELRYTMFDYRNGIIDIGKAMVIFKKKGENRWCVHTEVFNSDATLPSVSTENEQADTQPTRQIETVESKA